jgi:hypothetical protein
MKIVCDFDDFSNDTFLELGMLYRLRALNGEGFKVTLFTIPGKCSLEFLKAVKEIPWIELGIHGQFHTFGECKEWDRHQAQNIMESALSTGFFAPIFKAPNWLWSEGTYEACKELNIGVCDHFANVKYIPEGVKTYIWGNPEDDMLQLHGHVTPENGNYLGKAFNQYIVDSPDAEYLFVSEALK